MDRTQAVNSVRLTRRAVLRTLTMGSAVAAAGSLLGACAGGGTTPTPASGGA